MSGGVGARSGALRYQRGLGNFFETEAEPGALPREQNSPRRAPLGLYAEQLNGTSFTVPRGKNQRAWLYRILPSCVETPYEHVAHEGIGASDGARAALDPNLIGFRPTPLAVEGERACDFVDGLRRVGGAGDPGELRGMAVYVYVANADMIDRSFHDADGDLMILPDTGALEVRTELGVMRVAPGELAVVPRGIKMSVARVDGGVVRGYVGETFGRHFELPARGVIGASSLADARHFEVPVAAYEGRAEGEYRVTAKVGGALFEARRRGSPFDVVAWHGNYAPFRYDLGLFSPVGAVRIDHPDPSIYTVLTAPLDQPGESCLDFVIFPPRWDATEHTFRPPFFHRNAATEINGIVTGPTSDDRVFTRGGLFITPPFTGHGPQSSATDRALDAPDEDADAPERLRGALWVQFETTLPFRLDPRFANAPHRDLDFGESPRRTKRRFAL